MNKKEFAAKVSELAGLKICEGERAVEAMIETMKAAAIEGEPIKIHGLGTFKTKIRKGRTAANIKDTKSLVKLPDQKRLTYKMSNQLKDELN